MTIKYDCDKCVHFDTDECDDCSNLDDEGCSCHINPPCSHCVDNHFEEK